MKTASGASVGFVAVLLGIAAYAARPQDAGDGAAKPQPNRLIELLPLNTVVDVSFPNSGARVVILSDDEVRNRLQRAEQLTAKLKATEGESAIDSSAERREQAEIERLLQNISVPSRVAHVGENYVRLEPVAHIPLHEKISWFVLPESSIYYIKAKN